MDNKTVIEFGFHRMLRIMQISENAIVLLLFSSVQVLFFDLNTIQLHELTTFNQTKRWVLYACSLQFNLQSFTKFVQKVCFPFGKKNLKNNQYLPKEYYCNQCLYFE